MDRQIFGDFFCHFLFVNHNFGMENFLFDTLIKVIGNRPDKNAALEVQIYIMEFWYVNLILEKTKDKLRTTIFLLLV